jgi:hypothetical protein
MSCKSSPSSWTASAFTNGSDTTPAFLPLSEAMPLADLGAMATKLEVVARTTNFRVRPAYRLSQDQVTWGEPTGIGAFRASEGSYYADFAELSTTNGRFVQIGVQTVNTSSTNDIAKGTVQLEIGLRKPTPRVFEKAEVDLESGYEGIVANGFTASVTRQSSGYYRVQLTGKSAIADGIGEMYVRTFALRGNDGAVVDLSEGKYGVVWEILVDGANYPQTESLLFQFGPCQVSGSSLASPTTVAVASLMGFTTGASAGNRGNSKSFTITNSTTTSDGVRRMRAYWLPQIDAVGSVDFGWTIGQWLDASDDNLISFENLNSEHPDTTKPWGMALGLGFDASHANTQSADIRVFMRAFRLPNP